MRKVVLLFLLLVYSFIRSFGYSSPALAKVCGEKGETLEESREIEQDCKQRLNQLSSQRKTLSATLDYLNTQISLTQVQITKTQTELGILEKDINALGDRIADLNTSLDDLSQILVRHVRGTYSQSLLNDPVYLFFTSKGFTEFINRYQYLKAVQNNDKKIMKAMEVSRQNYNLQKTLKEQKQQEVEQLNSLLKQQQTKLIGQQTEKQQLLEITKNDEKKYQSLLEEARRELQSLINSRFADKRHVNKGEVIGLMGNTGFSTGPHLHFGVYNGVDQSNINNVGDWYYGKHQQPLDVLQSRNLFFENKSCDDVTSGGQNKIAGGGNLSWPMNNPRITQCYGHTPYSFVYSDNFHHGIDMADSNDAFVRAVEEGEAYFYKGTGSFGNNVRIIHPNGKMTLYLHLQ